MTCKRLTVSALALLSVVLVGCTSDEPAAPPPATNDRPYVSPELMRMVLGGLKSNDPRVQYASLERLSSFPEIVRTYREHVAKLQTEGKDERVRQKAAELLASLEEPAETDR